MKASTPPDALPFGDFLALLRTRGFILGVENYLRLAHLLERLGPQVAPAELKRLLAPIFATDAQEQEVFYEVFDSYFAPLLAATAGGVVPSDGTTAAPLSPTPRRRRAAWILATLLLLAVAILSPLIISRSSAPSPVRETTPQPATTIDQPPFPAAIPKAATPAPVATPPPQPTSAPRQVSLARRFQDTLLAHPNAARVLALALPFLVFAAAEWRRWRRRELLLDRTRGRKPPRAWPVRIAPPKIREFHSQPLFAAARALRRRQDADIERLDILRSLRATIIAGGLPRLVHRRGTRVPEYLVLIESASTRDHQAALFEQLVLALEREGVFLARYFFRNDPRICWNAHGTLTLADLRRLHPEHRVLIFSDGLGLLDPVTGAPASWSPILGEWRERILLTPATEWGWREETLAELLPVASATMETIAAVPDLLERSTVRPPPAAPRDDVPPSLRSNRTPSLDLLGAYLGPAAFEWLCACALYPELQWNLTLYLGAQLPAAEALLTEAALLRLVRLPWLRAGELPQELRARLLATLPAERQGALRRAIVALLENSPAPTGSHAADTRQLDIAIQRRWLRRHERAALAPREPVSRLPFSEQTRDYAELRLHEAGAVPLLAFLVPQRLRALLYDRATAALGFRPFVRLTGAALVACGAWLAMEAWSGSLRSHQKLAEADRAATAEMAVPFTARKAEAARAADDAQQLLDDIKPVEALERIDAAIALAPAHAGYHNLRGNILQCQVRLEESIEEYEEALRLDPKLAPAALNRELSRSILAKATPDDGYKAAIAELYIALINQGRRSAAHNLENQFGNGKQTLESKRAGPPPAGTPAPGPGGIYAVTNVPAGDSLVIRSGPGSQFQSVASLPPSTTNIRITGSPTIDRSDDWVPISFPGGTGWTRTKYLQLVTEQNPPASTPVPTATPVLATGQKPIPPGSQTYTVKAGDSLLTIAATFAVLVQELTAANFDQSDPILKPGMTLMIPKIAVPPAGSVVVQGRILAVNAGWNFVVTSLGEKNGVTNLMTFSVERDGKIIATLRVTSVELSNSIADVVPGTVARGVTLQPGDRVNGSVAVGSSAAGASPPLRPNVPVHAKILAVNTGWKFVVLSAGEKQGLQVNLLLLVVRAGQPIARLRVTSVEPSTSIADIIPGSVASTVTVQAGDSVVIEGSSSTPRASPPSTPAPRTPPSSKPPPGTPLRSTPPPKPPSPA